MPAVRAPDRGAAPAPWTDLAQAKGPGGETLVLRRQGGTFEIRCNGWDLMSNRAHHSEQELGRLGCADLPGAPRVLIGGLGMGYTLRAALDVLPAGARVTVAELFGQVVAWNRGPLAALAHRPLDDKRVELRCADVAALLDGEPYDAVLLDIDNGPDAAMLAQNAALYSPAGLRRLCAALAPGGRLAVWSADRSPGFEARLAACGLAWRGVDVPARGAADDPLHTLYLATPAAPPDLPPGIVLTPFEPGPWRSQLGLRARDPAGLIDIDALYPAQLARRRALLAERHAEVFGALPDSEAARAEVLALLGALLPARFPRWFSRDGTHLHNHLTGETWNLADPGIDRLEAAGRLVQEDLCVIAPGPDGPVLAAAVLCFPTRWRLADKLGRPLAAVHAPVPCYAARLARPVDRLIGRLRPGRMVERVNWSLLDDPALFQPAAATAPPITAANAGEALFLRTERQTLSALPGGAVLFAIRVRVHALARVCARPAEAARLAAAVRALPEEMHHYKNIMPFRAALLDWLDARGPGPDAA
jgi:hypothetical protein